MNKLIWIIFWARFGRASRERQTTPSGDGIVTFSHRLWVLGKQFYIEKTNILAPPKEVATVCLILCLTVCPAAYLVEGIPCASPCAFALLGRDTQRVWGLGEPLYLDKIHMIALSKEAIN